MLFVSAGRLERTVRVFERHEDHDLSITDTRLIALVEHGDVDAVLSFNDFDGLVDRIDSTAVDVS